MNSEKLQILGQKSSLLIFLVFFKNYNLILGHLEMIIFTHSVIFKANSESRENVGMQPIG